MTVAQTKAGTREMGKVDDKKCSQREHLTEAVGLGKQNKTKHNNKTKQTKNTRNAHVMKIPQRVIFRIRSSNILNISSRVAQS